MNPVFSYDQQRAIDGSSGGGQYITESCVTRGFIESAKWITANTGARGIELSFESERGQKCNFLTIYYLNKDGQEIKVGADQVHAMMGVTGVKQLTQRSVGNDAIIPELIKRPVALALERENYQKGDGSEGFRFHIKCFMSANSWLTVAEHAAGQAAENKAYWEKRFATSPTGKPVQTQARQSASQSQFSAPSDDFDDDIPF